MKAAAPAADTAVSEADADRAAPLDEAAFHALYRRIAAPLRLYAARVIGDLSRADDIVQETFLRLLRRPPPTDDPQQLRAYAFRIASNLIADGFRRERQETAVASLPEQGRDAPDLALRLDMQRLFRQLRPRDRVLMWLAHVEEQSHREIAEALGLGERSIRVLLSRARRRLAALIRRHARRSDSR